jgi:hypothetical protein
MRAWLCVALFALLAVAASAKHVSHRKEEAEFVDSDNEAQSLEEEEEVEENKVAEVEGDDDDGDRQLEEKEAAEKRVESDVERIVSQLEESDLSADARKTAKRNLEAIVKDAKELVSADAARATSLKQAIAKRMQAMQIILEENDKDEAEEVEKKDEKKVEKAKVEAKVLADIKRINSELEERSDLSRSIVQEAKEDVAMITKDTKLLHTANAQQSQALRKAIHLRVEALKEIVNPNQARDQEEVEAVHVVPKTLKMDKIHSDITSLEEVIGQSKLSTQAKKGAEDNLRAIEKDASKIRASSSTKEKSNLKEAMRLRMKALKQQLEEDGQQEVQSPRALEEKSSTIIDDIHRVQKAIAHSKLPKATRKAVKDNLSHMLHDAEEIPTAEHGRQAKLIQSLHLRMAALKKQAGEQ